MTTTKILDPDLIHEVCVLKNNVIRVDNDEQWITFNVPCLLINALTKLRTGNNPAYYKMLEDLMIKYHGGVPEWLRKRS